MRTAERSFELPKQIERYLAALSKLYAQDGERALQEIIVNSNVRIHEEWSYNNFDGGQSGHALYLVVPEELFLRIVRNKEQVSNRIRSDLNDLNSIRDEFIDTVFLEMDVPEGDWRGESGLVIAGKRVVAPESERRLWNEGLFRLFLSHKTEVKRETAELKQSLVSYGVSCFVAHVDIHPTRDWQDEMENALATADAFVALLTETFHDSDWTDQEVGYAIARGIPIIAVRLGAIPYGFIGKFQALSCNWDAAPLEIAKLLMGQDRMMAAYINRVRECRSFNEANGLALLLPSISALSEANAEALVDAYNTNDEVRGGFGFNGSQPGSYGKGLVAYLNALLGDKYRYADYRKIEPVT